jgi:hypothetical protein
LKKYPESATVLSVFSAARGEKRTPTDSARADFKKIRLISATEIIKSDVTIYEEPEHETCTQQKKIFF